MRTKRGFTLVELLVVVSIIALLVSILLPSLAKAKDVAKESICLTRLHAQVRAIHMYAVDNNGDIPVGPGTPMSPPMPPFPCNSIATNQLWIGATGSFTGNGALLLKHLNSADGFYCPGDNSADPVEEFKKFVARGSDDAYGSYLYRQMDQATSSKLDRMGLNDDGNKATVLSLDMNSSMPYSPMRTNHGGLRVNISFTDGHARTYDNPNGLYSLRAQDIANPFGRLDEILKTADKLSQ